MIMMIVKRARHGRRPGLVMLQKKKEGLKKDEAEKDDDDNKSIQGIDFLNRPFHSQMHKELTPGRRQ